MKLPFGDPRRGEIEPVCAPVHQAGQATMVAPWAAGLVGLILLVAGWVGVSGRATFEAQAGFVMVAVLGLVVAGAGAQVHISGMNRRLAERTARFEQCCIAWIEEQGR